MDELRIKAITRQCDYDFYKRQFDVKLKAYKDATNKLKETKWYNKWYYERKKYKAYLDLVMTAGRMYICKRILNSIIDKLIEKENGKELQN